MAELMIVDDDLDFLMSSSEVLIRRGHSVRPVMKSEDALKVIHEWSPDLILCDIRMPDMDGFELNVYFQRQIPLTPVVFVSAKPVPGESLLRGGRGFIRKPVDYRKFSAKVTTVLDQRLDFAKILVVDDSPYTRLLLTSVLEESFIVVTASHGSAAMDLLENDPEIELVITDLNMPEGGGLDLIRKIRQSEHLQNLPVMVQTGDDTVSHMDMWHELKVERVMAKDEFFRGFYESSRMPTELSKSA